MEIQSAAVGQSYEYFCINIFIQDTGSEIEQFDNLSAGQDINPLLIKNWKRCWLWYVKTAKD